MKCCLAVLFIGYGHTRLFNFSTVFGVIFQYVLNDFLEMQRSVVVFADIETKSNIDIVFFALQGNYTGMHTIASLI